MRLGIFISYRRDDTAASAGRLHDRLLGDLGGDANLFMDVDNVPLGEHCVDVLRSEVGKCDVLLAIIGPNWLRATDDDGNRRLDSVEDPVRIEIATALARGIPIIPIIFDGAKIPKQRDLPEELAPLAYQNGLEVRNASFHRDVEKLTRELK